MPTLKDLLRERAELVNHLVVHPDDKSATARLTEIESDSAVREELAARDEFIRAWRRGDDMRRHYLREEISS